jgi:hypothetical protein
MVSRRSAVVSAISTAGILVLAAVLRLLASFDDFWLDEIWSWEIVQQQVVSADDVLLKVKHENNHFLNSWWIYLVGPDADWRWYRLPAVILGTLTVVLARLAMARAGSAAVLAVSVLTVPSYLLVHYSSEARGYAYAVFFLLAAYLFLEKALADFGQNKLPSDSDGGWRRRVTEVLFGACSIAGCLGQPIFLMAYPALVVWAIARLVRKPATWRARMGMLTRTFLLPTAGLAALWFINISQMENGEGPRFHRAAVAASTLSLMVGGPEEGTGAVIVACLVAIAVIVELVCQARGGDDRWTFHLGMILVPPLVLLAMNRSEVYPRYFLCTVASLYLVLAELAARALSQGRLARMTGLAVLLAVCVGNSVHLADLFRFGRGHAFEVLRLIDSLTPGSEIVIATDQSFRHGMVLRYYERLLPPGRRIVRVDDGPWPAGGPAWLLKHSLKRRFVPPASIRDNAGNAYRLTGQFPYSGLSGWHTAVYHNERASIDSSTRP